MRTVVYNMYTPGLVHNPGWHYAHGQAEDFLGTDLVCTETDWVPSLGRSMVTLQNLQGQRISAGCYSWIDSRGKQRGLFVLLTDRESITYAAQCMLNFVNHL